MAIRVGLASSLISLILRIGACQMAFWAVCVILAP